MNMPEMPKTKKDFKNNIKSLQSSLIFVNVSKTKADVFIAVVLKCSG